MPSKIQKTIFMLRKLYKDMIRDRQIYELSRDLHSTELSEYYFIMTEEQLLSGHSQQYQFDGEGIPIIPAYIDVEEQKMVYYPISIGQYGLAIWHTYLRTKSVRDKSRFLKIAHWFEENRIEDRRLGVYWLTEVDKPAYGIFHPWKSAFSQARAINILLRAVKINNNFSYEEISEKALFPFLFPVSEGGVTSFTKYGPFYEEYPAEVDVLVLNGHIFALCGVYDFVRTHPQNSTARQVFEEGVTTLEKILPEYDLDFWSKYSLCQAKFHPEVDPATIGYHFLHIIQMELMFQLTGKDIFKKYSGKWKECVTKKNIYKMYKLKYQALKKMGRL
jgi:heparosan-N-sulfate-glucuronate 5-epimerase